ETLPTHAAVMRRTQPAPMSSSKSESEMGPTSSRSWRRCRISSWPAANGISGSSPVPRATLAPSATKASIASAIVMTLLNDPHPTLRATARPDCDLLIAPRGRGEPGSAGQRLHVGAVVALDLSHGVAAEFL